METAGGDAGSNNCQKIPLPVFPEEWRGWSSALGWPVAPKASGDNASPCPHGRGTAPGTSTGAPHTNTPKVSIAFPPKSSPGCLGRRKRMNLIFSADRSCSEALNGFQNSREKYGSQFTGLINNICLPARQGEGEDLPEQELCSRWEHLFQTSESHFPVSPAAFSDVSPR